MADLQSTIQQPAAFQLTVQPPAETVTVLQVGQGPSGPKGDKGDTGQAGSTHEHHQTTAASTWTVNHNLGFRPAVTILSVGGAQMLAEVIHASLNQVLVYFDEPMTGLAVCS